MMPIHVFYEILDALTGYEPKISVTAVNLYYMIENFSAADVFQV